MEIAYSDIAILVPPLFIFFDLYFLLIMLNYESKRAIQALHNRMIVPLQFSGNILFEKSNPHRKPILK